MFSLEGGGRKAFYAVQLGWEAGAFDFSKSRKQ